MTTAGEGGLFVTNDAEVWHKAWSYKDHGKNPDEVYRKDHPKGFRWLHESFGSNYRLTEIQSAIGRYQLKKLDKWLDIRESHVNKLKAVANEYTFLSYFKEPADSKVAAYRFYILVDENDLPDFSTRDTVSDAINEAGVPCFFWNVFVRFIWKKRSYQRILSQVLDCQMLKSWEQEVYASWFIPRLQMNK